MVADQQFVDEWLAILRPSVPPTNLAFNNVPRKVTMNHPLLWPLWFWSPLMTPCEPDGYVDYAKTMDVPCWFHFGRNRLCA